jgi:uncharacterized protein (TIGR03086 family)
MEPDWLVLQQQAHREFSARLARVTRWDAPTPDSEWTVRDLVRHVVRSQQTVPRLLAGGSVFDANLGRAALGPDLRREWTTYSALATAAWSETAADAPVRLARDTVTAHDYLREQVAEVTIHSWDLARAVSADESLDDELVAAVWTVFEPQRDALEASGLFAPSVPLPDDAPLQTRLLALTGRDSRI